MSKPYCTYEFGISRKYVEKPERKFAWKSIYSTEINIKNWAETHKQLSELLQLLPPDCPYNIEIWDSYNEDNEKHVLCVEAGTKVEETDESFNKRMEEYNKELEEIEKDVARQEIELCKKYAEKHGLKLS